MGGILTDFRDRLEAKEYISATLFAKIQKKSPESIPKDFNLDEYNDGILEKTITEKKDYFDHILDAVNPEIRLDKEQLKAIIADEDRELIIAGAGTGKTTTMTAKVKYLVDQKLAKPEEILVMSYTKRDVEDLQERINDDLGLAADVTTFHSLGYRYIRKVLRHKNCYVVGDNERYQIFYDYLREKIFKNPERLEDFLDSFSEAETGRKNLVGSFILEEHAQFKSFNDYFKAYKEKRLNETDDVSLAVKNRIRRDVNADKPRTLKGERVKSKSEALIANFLYQHEIDYDYERVYDEILPDLNSYRPDFTLNIGGQKIYIEYFGMSGDDEARDYARIRKLKEDFHRRNYNSFIALDYKPRQGYLQDLRDGLQKLGISLPRSKSNKELLEAIIDSNPLAEFWRLREFFYEIVDTIKVSLKRDSLDAIVNSFFDNLDHLETRVSCERQFKYLREFYLFYERAIHHNADKLGFDFSDMIYYAKRFIGQLDTKEFNYKYIIIDEYQDISMDRYELARDMMERSNAKLVAVGDDWQTIYSFSGSRIEYIYNFREYFENAKVFTISKSYRNPQSLLSVAGEFIMKNPDQLRKQLRANHDIADPFVFINFDGVSAAEAMKNEYEQAKLAIMSLHRQRPNDKIIVLARTNATLRHMFDVGNGFISDVNTKVKLEGVPDFTFDAMTIHKAKGITADWVIVIGLNDRFPLRQEPGFWLARLFAEAPREENISYAEERRVFYVALTRARYKVVLLRDTNAKRRSSFLNEIYSAIRG